MIKNLLLRPQPSDSRHHSAGFTLVELLVVMAMFATIFAFSQVNLTGLISQTDVREQASTVLSDLRRHQLEAISGSVVGAGVRQPTGVQFSEHAYTLFYGDSLTVADNSFSVQLEPEVRFTDSYLPDNTIIFEPLSGAVRDYQVGQNSIRVESEVSGEQYQLTINQYGVVELERLPFVE